MSKPSSLRWCLASFLVAASITAPALGAFRAGNFATLRFLGGEPGGQADPDCFVQRPNLFSPGGGRTAQSSLYQLGPQHVPGTCDYSGSIGAETELRADLTRGLLGANAFASDTAGAWGAADFLDVITLSADATVAVDVALSGLLIGNSGVTLRLKFIDDATGITRFDQSIHEAGTLSGEVALIANTPTRVLMELSTFAGNYQTDDFFPGPGGSAIFNQTAALSLDLPAGVTMASESGVFLTQPIPEPTGLLPLLAAGFLWAGQRRPLRTPPIAAH